MQPPPPQTGERRLAPSPKSLSGGPSDQQPYRGDGFDFRDNSAGEDYQESRFGPTTTAENRRAHEFDGFGSKGGDGDSSEDDDDNNNSDFGCSEPFQGTGSGGDSAGDDHNSAFGGSVQFQHTDSGDYGYVSQTEDEYGDTNKPNKSRESSGGGNNNNKEPPRLANTKKSAVARPKKTAASESTQAAKTDGIPSVESSLHLRPESMTKGGGLRAAVTKSGTKTGEPPVAASRRNPARPSTKATSKKGESSPHRPTATQAASSAWKPKGGSKVMIVKPGHKQHGTVGTVVLQEPPSWKFRVDYTMPDGTAASSSFQSIQHLAPVPDTSAKSVKLDEAASFDAESSDVESVDAPSHGSSSFETDAVAEEETDRAPVPSRGPKSRGLPSVETDSVAEEATVAVAEKETDSVAFAVAAEETVAVEEEESEASFDEGKSDEDELDEDADAPTLVEESERSLDIDDAFDALALAANAVELEFNRFQSNGDIVMTNLETAQGADTYNGCAMISVYTVHHLLHTSGAISNSDMTTCMEKAGRTLQKIRDELARRRGEDDFRRPEEDLMTIDDASDLFNNYERPKKLANVVVVGGNIFWGEHLNNLVTTLLEIGKEAAAAVFIKGHFVTLSKFRTDSDTFAYDLLEPLPSHGSEVGTRIRCYSLDALKVAMMQYAQWRLTDDEYQKARTTKWEDEFLYEEKNSAADKRIFQAHMWVSENANNNSPVDAQRTRHLSHQAHRPHSPPESSGRHHKLSVNSAGFSPDENSPPRSSVVQRPSPSRDWIAGPKMHRCRESRDSTLSSEDHREPVAKEKNENDDWDEEVAHAGSGLKAAAKHSSVDPSTLEDETSDCHRRKNNEDIDSAVLSKQQNTSQQNQPTVTRRSANRSGNRSTTRAPASQLRARDLAQTNLSRSLEAYLEAHMPNNNLVVREVARKEKTFERHSLLCDDDAEEGSEEGHYVERTILVFDELDDADLIKFGLCFQEHGSESLEENQGTVYIDCIDSVKLRAKGVTLANHSHTFRELLLGYLAYTKDRGLKEYHLWACPPAPRPEDGTEEQSGTPDFLFCKKPPEQQQQTPDEQRLVGHYWTISREAYHRGILLADYGEPETYADQYFDNGELLDKIPVFPGGIVESMLNVCHNNDVDKQMVQQSLGTYLEHGVTEFDEESGCALRKSLIVGTLNADDPDQDAIRADLDLEEPAPLFSDLFDDWGHFRLNEYSANPDWGFSDYDKVKRTSQGIIAKLHRDVEKMEKKKRRRAAKCA